VSKVSLHEYLNEIQHLLDEEMFNEAAGHCRSILRQHPRHVDTYRLLGQALLEQDEYSAAEDVFQRILGALPNDLTVHIGLSIIGQETGNLPKAIWHMQRAYELDPYNSSLQSELKKLYKQRDGRTPAKLVLTQGALAHLHFQGEMYQTAVSGWLAMLKKEPERLDLKVMLAEAYWRQNKRVDAVELSRHILEEAPNCIQPNAIIAEIWLLTGRVDEAQPYLQHLQALTQISEATFEGETAVSRAFSIKGAPALFKQIMVERGEGDERTAITDEEETAVSNTDWLSEVDVSNEDDGDSSDWFSSQAAAATALVADKVDDPTGWLHGVEAEDDNGIDDFDDLSADLDNGEQTWLDALTTDADDLEDVSSLPETDADAILGTSDNSGLPDWLGDGVSDSSGDALDWFAEEETAVSNTPLAADDELDWLGELTDNSELDDLASDDLFSGAMATTTNASASGDSSNDNFDDFFGSTPAETASDDSDDDDLFDGLGLSGLLVGTAAAGVASTLYDDKKEDDDSLDWLNDDLEPLTTGTYTATDDSNDVDDLFGGPGLTAMLTGNEPDDNDESTGTDLPDWLNQSDEADTTSPAEDLPDWLTDGEDEERAESIGNDALPDWLTGGEEDELVEAANEDTLPDWLNADTNKDDTDNSGDSQLTGITAVGVAAGGVSIVTTMNNSDDEDVDDFPDWLGDDLEPLTSEERSADNDLDASEDLFGGPGLTAMLLGGEPDNNHNDFDNDDALPDWIDDDVRDLAGDSAMDSDDLPDWLSTDFVEDDNNDDNAPTGAVAAGAVVGGIAIAMHDDENTREEPEDTTMSSDEEKDETGLPEELFTDMPENEDGTLDWLEQLADDQNLDPQDAISAEEDLASSSATDDLPDWLQDSPEPTELMSDALDFDMLEEDPLSDNAGIPDWLQDAAPTDSTDEDASYASQVAAGEGDIFDEMPTQVSTPDPFTGEEDSSEFATLFADVEGDDDFSDLFADTEGEAGSFNDLFGDADDAPFADEQDALPEENDGVDMGEAALLGLAGAATIASLNDDEEEVDADPLSFLAEDTADDGFSDLFADMDDSSSDEFDALFADEPDALLKENDLVDMDDATAIASSDEDYEEIDVDPLSFLAEDTGDDDFSELFADMDDIDDPLAGFDTEDEDSDDIFAETVELKEEVTEEIIEKEKEKFEPAGAIAASALAAALAKRKKKDEIPVPPPIEEEDAFDDMFADIDSVEDPLADLDLLKKETAVSIESEEDADMLDFLADDMDADDLDDLFGGETAVDAPTFSEEAGSTGMLDFLADDTDEDDLGDLFDELDAITPEEDETNEEDSSEKVLAGMAGAAATAAVITSLSDEDEDEVGSDDMLDSIIAFEGQGIDDDLFAEAGMGDSITDSEISDLSDGLDWLDDSVADTGELTAFDWMDDEMADESILAESPLEPPTDAVGHEPVDDQISWLDELAAQQDDDLDEEMGVPDAAILAGGVAAGVITADLFADDSEDDETDIDDAMSWLEDLSDEDSEPTEQLPSIADVVDLEPDALDDNKTPFFSDIDDELPDDTLDALELDDASQTPELLDAEETAVDDAMAWLDDLDSDVVETAVETEAITDTEKEAEPITIPDTDETALDEDLDDAMAWLDDLEDDESETELKDVVAVAAVAGATALVADEISDSDNEDEDETEEAAQPTRLSRALDWFEALAAKKGVVLSETAVDIEVSDDDLAEALDGLDALTASPIADDTRDDELWIERAEPELSKEPKEMRYYEDGTPVPEDAVETSEGFVVWRRDDEEDAVDLGIDLDFSDMFDDLDLIDDEDAPVEMADKVTASVDEEDEYTDYAVETSEGLVVWRKSDEEDAVDLGVDLDFSDMFDDLDLIDEKDDLVETVEETIPPVEESTGEDEFANYAVETSEGLVTWKLADQDDAVDLDFDFDIPEDPDEMAAWLLNDSDDDGGTDPKVSAPTATESGEELQAQQSAASDADAADTDLIDNATLPSFNIDLDDGVPVTLPEDPDEAVAWLGKASDEQESDEEFNTFDTSPIDEILDDDSTDSVDEPLIGEDIGLGHDLSDSMPEWLSFTSDSNETDWLSALPEADVSGWLEAEGDVGNRIDSDWATVDAPRSRSRENKPADQPQAQRNIHAEDLHLPETSMLPSGFSLDGEKLRDARRMVNSGDTKASLSAYRSLIQKGDGLNVIISDLEVASQKFTDEPEICHLLGDAYTQNGQLQKALSTYRDALKMM